jgi:serine-type D-Ala-D-Ala carboxypeptidase/endopeptidase (penicillin-binding protein 4)
VWELPQPSSERAAQACALSRALLFRLGSGYEVTVRLVIPRKTTAVWALILAGTLLGKGATEAEASPESPATVAKAFPEASPETSPEIPPASQSRPALSRLIAWVAQNQGRVGVSVVELRDQRVVVDHAAAVPMNPASTSKLLTAAVVLSVFGPEARFTTRVHGRIESGRTSRLILWGDGDPSLGTGTMVEFSRRLVELGLRRVDGPILVDQSRFDDRFVPPAFEQQPGEWAAFRAPVCPVALERNTVTLKVAPGEPGKVARITLVPPNSLPISGTVMTEVGKGQKVKWSVRSDKGVASLVLEGSIGVGAKSLVETRRLDDPRLVPGRTLQELLRIQGVTVAGPVELGRVEIAGARSEPVLVDHQSPPLSALLFRLGKNSDNFVAEMLLKSLGTIRSGGPGSSEAGADAVRFVVSSWGKLEPSTTFVNGSGLFDANRVAPQRLVAVLAAMARDPKLSSYYLGQLAEAGVDGTLRSRLRNRPKDMRVFAKTGTLRTVHSLAGYVYRGDRSPLAFAVIVEGATDAAGTRARIDDFVLSLYNE